MVDIEAWLKRADEVLGTLNHWDTSQGMQFATSMIAAFYGPDSPQMKTFRESAQPFQERTGANPYLLRIVRGTILNTKAEIQAGLIKKVRALLTGEIVAELLALATETLEDHSEAAKNVGAVLVAAAFEDTIRRMGAEFAGLTTRPRLEEVITSLKQNDVLKGGAVATALSYLKFRNDSLHADWAKVERTQAASCLAFVQELLVKHFS